MLENIFYILIICLSIVVYWVAGTFPKSGGLDPAIYPRIIAILMIIFSSVLLIKKIISKEVKEYNFWKDPEKRKGIYVLAIIIIYFIGLNTLGFILSTIFLLTTAMWIFKIRNYFKLAIYSVSLTVIIFYVFNYLLQITLP